MTKDIYIITNDINNKVYIGQAKNTDLRWSGHKSAAKCHNGFIEIDKAMAKLGIDHFHCNIIEKQVEDYNERERYWIKYYNSLIPNGYNKDEGGEGTFYGVNSPSASIKEQEVIDNIISELKDTNSSLDDIANKYNLTRQIVSSINRGTSYFKDGVSYPIRKRMIDKLNDLDINKLYNDIINTNKSRSALAKEYNTSIYVIDKIIKGEKYHDNNFTYPLRKSQLRQESVQKIINMIKETTYSLREIAKICETSYTTVAHINSGKYHHDDTLTYPIRS